MDPKPLVQHFYIYQIPNGYKDGMPHVDVVMERISFPEGERPARLAIPGWRGWWDEMVMRGEHPV